MDDKLLIKKIQALLHDPPEKAIILGKIGHEGRAKEIMTGLVSKGDAKIPDEVKTADHIASAADRINFPKHEHFIADFCGKPVIKHPLSAKEFDLKKLPDDIADITAAVDRAIVSLADTYLGNNEQLYLALWRELIYSLMDKQNDKAHLGQLWELLPADTRIPDHSIWEHKRITSAIAGALPKPAFLLFAIGPVQDFIATARKTQDLWAGSYLFSYLSWSAMKVVVEEFGPDCLIFPDLCGQPFVDKCLIDEKQLKIDKPRREELSSPTLPNRFLAIVPEDMVLAIAGKAKTAVKETFQSVCSSVKSEMEKRLGITAEQWEAIWSRQTEDFIEAYWAATPASNYAGFLDAYKKLMGISNKWEFDSLLKQYEEKGFAPNIGTLYSLIYKLTEKALGSRKAIRDFRQTTEPNHKCTLCGVREPVHSGIHKDQNCTEEFGALRGFWQDKILPSFPQLRKSERLCAVCVSKRLSSRFYFRDKLGFDIDDNFPSVSMIATSAFKLRVIENISLNHLSIKVGNYVEAIKNIAGERWRGIPLPMVIRACKGNSISEDFARLEGDWLYKEAFDNEDALWEENKNRVEKADFKELLRTAKDRQKELFAAIRELDKAKKKDEQIGSPSAYYAVFLMDGDNMGKWLSGEYAPTIADVMHPVVKNTLVNDRNWQELLKQKRPLNPSLHLATSKALRDFSLKVVREIVEKDHLGKLVYAGGDDVLAFVNLKDLLEVMRKLRAYFSGSLKANEETNKVDIDFGEGGSGFIPIDDEGRPINVDKHEKHIKGFILSMGTNATASMGVVIAHHNSNLSQVLDEVRKCEKEAKKLKDKNAFCVALAKRAGGTEHVQSKWLYKQPHFEKGGQGRIFETIPLLRQWANAFYHDYISPKFVYTFRTETKGLEGGGLPEKAVELELLRISNRQRNKSVSKLTEEQFKEITNWIMSLPEEDKKKIINELKGFYEEGKIGKIIKVYIRLLVNSLMILHKHGHSLDDIGRFLSLAAFLGREGNR
ncbi:MAG: type III-B CRISPR-associated protein Cas10/Cmr2 [Nitrospirota bacterium]